MRRHLKSAEHKENTSIKGKFLIKSLSLPKKIMMDKCTQNACLISQLMASYTLPSRFYPDLMFCIQKMLSNTYENFIHPCGNIIHSHSSVTFFQFACYEALLNDRKLLHKSCNKVTCHPKRFMIAADKGKVFNDVKETVIVATYVNKIGFPVEDVISSAAIYDKSANGAAVHFKRMYQKQ